MPDTTTKPAPRLAPSSNSMAKAARELGSFKLNGLLALSGGAEGGEHLEMAHAMLRFHAAAMRDRDQVNSVPGGSSNIDDLNGEQMSLALDGIAYIVAMHAFHRDAEIGGQ